MRTTSSTYRHIGLLIIRVGLGIMFIIHGYPKLFGGPEAWASVGETTQAIGIGFFPEALGFFAAVTELFGGILIMLGIFYRPTLCFMIFVMGVAASVHIANGDSFAMVSHPIEIAIVFLGMICMGPGKYGFQRYFNRPRRRW